MEFPPEQIGIEVKKQIATRTPGIVASELDFRLVVDTIPGLVCTLKANGELELVNQRVREYFGKTLEQMRDGKLSAIAHPDDLERVLAQSRDSITTGEPFEIEQRCRRYDGIFRWFQVRAVPLRDPDENIGRWCVLFTDIEDRKRSEEALRAKEHSLSLIINTMPVLAWSARPDGTAEFFNDHYLEFTGFSMEQAEGWGWTDAVHPDDAAHLFNYWQSIMPVGRPGEIEARMRRFDGVYRWFLFRANPLRDETGSIVKWYGTNTDIEDRKQAEEQSRRSEAFLAEAQHLTRIGSFSWCVESHEIRWSEELYSMFGFEPGTPITFERIAARCHPDDLGYLPDMHHKAEYAADLEYEHRIVLPDGSIKYLHLIAHATHDEQGRLEYIGAAQDLTQRRLAEEALAKARQELANVTRITSLGVLTASIAHEVNQPLAGIITNASTCLRMLNGEPPNIEGARETVRRTIRDGNRASEVITRLRTLFSKKEIAAEPVDLSEVAREVIALSLGELQRNRVFLKEELADDLPHIQGDRIQLQQVILNLLRNASDAMNTILDRRRQIRIRTERDQDNCLRLSVEDSGIGFDPQLTETLFEAFHTTKSKGMGIGLSVSRSIIEAHRGKIWAAPNDGPGSTFSFSIPCGRETTQGIVSAEDAGTPT